MEIKKKNVPIRDIIVGYVDLGNEGVEGWKGKLDIRPPYQREFIYTTEKQRAVIDSVRQHFPLGIIYWVDNTDKNNRYEVLDGQQRILSICKYVSGDYSIEGKNGKPYYFHNLTQDEKDNILDYELDVYVCIGTEREKLEWFERINVQGEVLTDQELRNASYTGPWLSDAKTYFSKNGAPVEDFSDYLSGRRNRQDYLETVLEWISEQDYGNTDVTRYMAEHQKDENARELWLYFFRTIGWVHRIFPENYYRKEMKGIEWGVLYNNYKDIADEIDPVEIEERVKKLMLDDEVKNKKGIYYYIFDGNEKHLNLRSFTPAQKRQAYELQEGHCANSDCPNDSEKGFQLSEMEADHVTPWSQGGKTNVENLQLLCRECNRRKSSI